MSDAFYVVGAGGLGRETLDTAIAAGLAVAAFLDDALAGSTVREVPVIKPAEPADGGFVIGIADPRARLRLSTVLEERGLAPRTLVHPRSAIAPETTLGGGCLVLSGAYVSSNVLIGPHSQVQYNATVGHDAYLGARVTIYPGANVSGSVILERDVSIGSNAVVLQGRTVGAGAFVGAGAVVTRDVPAQAVVVGNPARPLHGDR